jgi:hypothetical protein
VYGIGALSGLFARYWSPARIKRGRLLSWDDARQQNLIFVGGPQVNLRLDEVPQLQRFRFELESDGSERGKAALCDAQAPGRCYGHSPRPYNLDHAVIALFRRGANRATLLLAGDTTVGTHAAVDFVVHEETVRQLLAALRLPAGTPPPDFEAVIETHASDGVPLQSRIVATHLRR